ncbi:X-ray repair cross-complementing protein 5 isoform X2 [Lagopus muta]|uniref:X-ray repair cross-complementing protein 5 isoform X2 n=1 Tax=Lagopus muta TaxID=64668 RepID=UPI0020A226B8|nr:X-ray repair cross-complementing protein 5 isoform X2 [Lagopus muta]
MKAKHIAKTTVTNVPFWNKPRTSRGEKGAPRPIFSSPLTSQQPSAPSPHKRSAGPRWRPASPLLSSPLLFLQPRSRSPCRWVALPGLQAPAGALIAAHRGADKMARGGKSAIVLCLDVGITMSSSSAPGEESPLEQAKRVMTKFLQRQVFAESKDEVAVVLFGTDGTKNNLASRDQYQNITVHRSLMLPDFDLLEDIQNTIQLGSEQADFLDAIIVCMDLLQQETLGKKFEKRHIELFTDLSSPVSEDQLEIIIANLKKTGTSLQFFLPFPVDGADGHGDASANSQLHQNSFPRKRLTAQQKEGIDVVKKLMHTLDEEGGLEEIYTFRESLERLAMFKKIERRPAPWSCQLTIGSNLSIRIVAYKALTEEKVKKIWTVVDAKTLRKEDVQRETVYCLNDDDETEVQKDDTIQGFRYGSDIIPFSKEDEEQMKYKTEAKCFSVLGFSRTSQIQRHCYMGNQVLKVFAAKDDENAAVAFSALVQALDELNVVAIVRYAYDRRCNPQIGVAFPCIKDAYECLFYVQLPYMEDVRQYMFSSLKNNKKCSPTVDQLSAIDSMIDSMNLVYEDDDGETFEDLFKPSKIPNPHFQRLYQCLQHKAFHPNEPLPPIEQHLLEMLEVPCVVKERCKAPLEKVKALFPLKDAGKKKEEKTAQDIFKDDEDGPNAKRRKTEDEEDSFSIMKLAEGNVTSVGSINPAEDFRILVRQKNADFKDVSQQLINRIDQFLENRSSQYYMKGINCIRVFRGEAMKLSKVQCFNDFLQALKSKVEDKALTDFWEIVVQDRISLITKDEAEGSSVTSEEAEKFLTPKEKKNETLPAADEGGDVDDLLDMM